jgi:Tol biopolymer transport system component
MNTRRILISFLALTLAACSVAVPIPAQPTTGANPILPGSTPDQNTGNLPIAATPIPWAGLGLKGRLILILQDSNGFAITSLDLITGNITQIFQADPGALLGSALVSPDGKQILLTYAPPASQQNQLTYTSLYLMPVDGSSPPKSLFATISDSDAYFAPTWAPDGKSIFTSHFHQGTDPSGSDSTYTIDQVTLDGRIQPVIQNGQWPRLSPDGKQLSYVTAFSNNGQNDLYQASIGGQNISPVIKPGTFLAVDDHFYTPDGKSIIFSAVNPSTSYVPSFLDRLFGITVASAHTIPSDWYEIPVAGGDIKRLTNLGNTGMFASISPDHNWIAFISATGIYVMKLDGTNLTQLSPLAATGTVDWIQ